MNWDPADFIVFGALLLAVGIGATQVMRKSNNARYRLAAGVALTAAFLLVWVNGAVGIIGDANNDANMLYVGVLALGVIGAVITRLEATGMARTLYAMALAQVLVAVVALAAGWGSGAAAWPQDVLLLTVFFTALWTLSGWLFGKVALSR